MRRIWRVGFAVVGGTVAGAVILAWLIIEGSSQLLRRDWHYQNATPERIQDGALSPASPHVTTVSADGKNDRSASAAEIATLAKLKEDWSSIQKGIFFRPHYHDLTFHAGWPSPIAVQFIGDHVVLINFEDDDTSNFAVLTFENGAFAIQETFRGKVAFTSSQWRSLVQKYGGSSAIVSTYTKAMIRNRKTVIFGDYTRVPENVFLEE